MTDADRTLRRIEEIEPDKLKRFGRYGLPPWPVADAPALDAQLWRLRGAEWEEAPERLAYVLRREGREPQRILAENDADAIRQARVLLARGGGA